MKKKLLFINLIIICVIIVCYVFNNFFTSRMIEGMYANRNYHYSSNKPEIPYVADTLTLFADNKFYSKFWGKGSYSIKYSISGTEIELVYDYEFGKAGYKTFIDRLNFGKPKIILNLDNHHYYEKLK